MGYCCLRCDRGEIPDATDRLLPLFSSLGCHDSRTNYWRRFHASCPPHPHPHPPLLFSSFPFPPFFVMCFFSLCSDLLDCLLLSTTRSTILALSHPRPPLPPHFFVFSPIYIPLLFFTPFFFFLLAGQSVSLHDVADETGSGYGIEVAQLQKSSDLLTQAFRLAHK